MQKILITGSAGFIGFHLAKALIKRGYTVIGIDNLNHYYDPELKKARLEQLELFTAGQSTASNYHFIELDISDHKAVKQLFETYSFDGVVNLAAQAGVRYSIENPNAYVESNLVGFVNILEGCRHGNVKHFVYASSSSVYGMNQKQPFSTEDCVDFPISLYAATKKSNELMAHTYSHLYDIPVTGLRFFTVYGEWGRPDMAYFKFTKSILEGNPIDVFNHGVMQRDFTDIEDIIEGVVRVLGQVPGAYNNFVSTATPPYAIYNIGNNHPVSLRAFITTLEQICGKKAIEKSLPMQAGDVPITYADIDPLIKSTGFKPSTSIEAGLERFVKWYRAYYNV